jgi:hypothetical protein
MREERRLSESSSPTQRILSVARIGVLEHRLSLAASTLDSKYTLVKVVWNMRFDRSASEPIYSQNRFIYSF